MASRPIAAPEVDPLLLDTTATVETPERVRFRYRLAGPGRRGLAWLLDGVLRLMFLAAVALVVAALSGTPTLMNVGLGVLSVIVFAVDWLYGAVFETLLGGRTPGKLALSLRVVHEDGSPATFPDYLLRNLLRAVDFVPALFGLGVLVMAIDPRFRRIGDWAAGTVVVVEDKAAVLGRVAVDPPVTEAERRALPPRVDLRRDEIEVIEAFLRRRRYLTATRAEELAAYLGPALAARTGVTAPSWERVLALAYARATGKDR